MDKAPATALKIHTLKKGWHDKDEILLHAAFQLLVDFVEQEHPETIDWNANKMHRQAWKEIKSLSGGGRVNARQEKVLWTARDCSGPPSSSRKSPAMSFRS